MPAGVLWRRRKSDVSSHMRPNRSSPGQEAIVVCSTACKSDRVALSRPVEEVMEMVGGASG